MSGQHAIPHARRGSALVELSHGQVQPFPVGPLYGPTDLKRPVYLSFPNGLHSGSATDMGARARSSSVRPYRWRILRITTAPMRGTLDEKRACEQKRHLQSSYRAPYHQVSEPVRAIVCIAATRIDRFATTPAESAVEAVT